MISIIIPCFNEEDNIAALFSRLKEVLERLPDHEILFIDDGSCDSTLKAIQNLCDVNDKVKFISFSRNFGHQNALRAGFEYAIGDCAITMDADLQHPPEMIEEMVEKWHKGGYKVVYTVRKPSNSESLFKRTTSFLFYKTMAFLSDIDLAVGAADFRLLDRSVLEEIKRMPEASFFVRGMVSWIGFSQCPIEYVPSARFSGESKYTFKKMFLLAIDGMTSFSIRPLRIATVFGTIFSVIAFLYGGYAAYQKIIGGVVAGWTSIIICILLIGGIQLIMLGIIGEYVGNILIESKKRPSYIIASSSQGIKQNNA